MNPRINLTAQDRTAAAFAAVTKRVEKLGFNLDTLKGTAIGALGALAIPVSAAGLISMLNSTRDVVDGFKDLSDATGSSIENISALDRIARATGGNFDQVSTTLLKFNQVLKDADPDTGAGAVLKALNLDIEELKRLDPAEALRQTAMALQGFADDGNKARAVQELFGKSVKEVGPLLKDLAESGGLVATMSTQSAEEVDRFNKELARLQANSTDVWRSLSVDGIAALNKIIDRFNAAQASGKGFWESQSEAYWQWVRQMYGIEEKAPEGFQPTFSPDDQSSAEMARLRRQNERPSLAVPDKPDKPKRDPKDPLAESKRYLESLQRQLESLEELTAVEQAQRDLALGRLGKVTAEQERQILATAQQIDLERELAAATKEADDLREESARKAREAAEERRQTLEDLVNAGATAKLEKQRAVIQELTAAYERQEKGLFDGADAQLKYTEAVQAYLGIADDQAQKISEVDQFTVRAAENIQDYLGESLFNILEGKFDDILGSFMSMLNRMVAEAAAAQIAKHLFGGLVGGSGTGVLGNFLGAAAGALFGTSGTAALASSMGGNSLDNFLSLNNNFSSVSVPKFDVGSDFVPRDMLAVVHRGEAIIPAAENMQGGGRGAVIYQTVNVLPGANRQTGLQAAADARRQLERGGRNA